MTFEEFAAARLPGLLRFAAVLTGDRGVAEDVVQEVLLRVYGRWQRISRMPPDALGCGPTPTHGEAALIDDPDGLVRHHSH